MLKGDFPFTMPAFAPKQKKAKQGNVVIPGDLVFAVWTKRAPKETFFFMEAINQAIQKRTDDEAEEKDECGVEVEHKNKL